MFKCLAPGAIGIKLSWDESLAIAAGAGFEAVDIWPLEVSRKAADWRRALKRHGLRAGGTPLPVEFRRDEATFRATLAELDAKARLASEIGCTRFYMWILPASDELPFDDNYRLHVERLGAAAKVLAKHDLRLGLEFIGPKTMRVGRKYEFVHTLGGMMRLAADVGPNAGLMLDSWHWYTSRGTVKELLALTDRDVVYVHVNDAPAGIPIDEQQDPVRRLPGETGVEDIAGFMGALKKIDYTGPVTPEPFVKELAEMLPEKSAALAAQALNRIWPG